MPTRYADSRCCPRSQASRRGHRRHDLALHDAQSVIAREHGFPSWNALREEVEARTLSFDAAVDEFVRCATGGASGRAERLLALHPRIASATLQTALVLGDAAPVERGCAIIPELATAAGGPMQWEPLLYACHTCMHTTAGARRRPRRDRAALCALGANPNAEYHWNWHPELPRTALWGAVCASVICRSRRCCLRPARIRPTASRRTSPGEAATSTRSSCCTAIGLNVNGIPGGVPPLVYMMLWATTLPGRTGCSITARTRISPWGDDGEAPLHVAARRWDVPMVERLVQHGADVSRRRADGAPPHTLAELHGNPDIARGCWRTARRTSSRRSSVSSRPARAPIARRGRDAGRAPDPASQLRPEHHLMLHRPAESGNAAVLETMLSCGFGPNVRDNDR